MQKKQLRNLKKNTEETQRMLGGKKKKKRLSEEENYQRDLQQESYLGNQIKDTTKSTEQD